MDKSFIHSPGNITDVISVNIDTVIKLKFVKIIWTFKEHLPLEKVRFYCK